MLWWEWKGGPKEKGRTAKGSCISPSLRKEKNMEKGESAILV